MTCAPGDGNVAHESRGIGGRGLGQPLQHSWPFVPSLRTDVFWASRRTGGARKREGKVHPAPSRIRAGSTVPPSDSRGNVNELTSLPYALTATVRAANDSTLVHEHGVGAARAHVAAFLASGETEPLPRRIGQGHGWIDSRATRRPVHSKRDMSLSTACHSQHLLDGQESAAVAPSRGAQSRAA